MAHWGWNALGMPFGGDRQMAQRLILTLLQGGCCLKTKYHCRKAEHCNLDPYGQSGAMFSGKSTALQWNSLLVVSSSPLLTGQVLERIATEFNQLQFHAVQSKGMPLLDKVRPVSVGWAWALGCRESYLVVSSMLALIVNYRMLTLGLDLGLGFLFFQVSFTEDSVERFNSPSLSF